MSDEKLSPRWSDKRFLITSDKAWLNMRQIHKRTWLKILSDEPKTNKNGIKL